MLALHSLIPICILSGQTEGQQRAQGPHDHQLMSGPTIPSKTLADGAKDPESISDETAYEVFLNTTAASATSSEHEMWTHRNKFARAQFDDDETKLIQGILATFYSKRAALEQERSRSDNPTTVDSAWHALVASTRAELASALSPVGYAKLEAHIRYLKSRIKVLAPATN